MLNNRKVNFAKFHQALFIPGLGTIGDQLPSNSKTLTHLEMSYSDAGIYVKGTYKGITSEALVPWPNVVVAGFAPEDKAAKAS